MLAVLYLFTSVGLPTPSPAGTRTKDISRPFPCMDRPCGCLTYEACWAGDCCCFTLAEKRAWANAHNITPPTRAAAVEHESCCDSGACGTTPREPACQLCEKPVPAGGTSAVKWVVGVFDQKCKGQTSSGLIVMPAAVPPPAPFRVVIDPPSAAPLTLGEDSSLVRRQPPDTPPPRP